MKEKEINWDNLSENLSDLQVEGVLDGEESHDQIIATEEEFQALLKALHEE